ncbi:hypothetical protein [Vulgatibacter sp.]|uniref:hypothetical protein n=1 Tax=Vulgatibacter sp. TaxID=1971226 RepID=UPI003562CE46
MSDLPPGLEEALGFPLFAALFGRRARRFALGAAIPDGPLAFTSRYEPHPLSELERLLVVTAATGNTAWHHLITRNARYAPHLSNYCGAAGGRTFPSAAGFHTSQLFFTDDSGIFFVDTRDAPALVDRQADGALDAEALLAAHRGQIRQLEAGRLHLPREEPYMEGHNTWNVNVQGSLLLIPVGDLAQHVLATLCYYLQNGYVLTDDVHGAPFPGLERFRHLADVENPLPLSFVEQLALGELSVELGASCYAGMLSLQAMGLGGWMFDGLSPQALLGASGDPAVPGLGFRYDERPGWPVPNPTGRAGVFEAFCPPHFPDMRAAVEALVRRKFGPGGPFHRGTPGPFRDSPGVRGSAQVHDEAFQACVALQAQTIFERFGKFPGTVPSVLVLMYLQAHHLDLEFYDTHFAPGAYLSTHAHHFEKWHGGVLPKRRDGG